MASKDPDQPADQPAANLADSLTEKSADSHEPDNKELGALLDELQDEHAAQGGVNPPEPSRASSSAAPAAPVAPQSPTAPEAYRAQYPSALSNKAAYILLKQSRRSPADQRALGIPDAALAPDGTGWLAAVQAWLQEQSPERIFGAWVANLAEWPESEPLSRLAIAAAAQLPTIAPYVKDIGAAERNPILHSGKYFASVLAAAPADAAFCRLMITLLSNLDRRSVEEQLAIGELAGTVARKWPELAVAIATQARKQRLPQQLPQRNSTEDQALGVAAQHAALPELGPTATLGLTNRRGSTAAAKQWALALATCDPQGCIIRLLDREHGIIGYSFGLHSGVDVAAAAVAALPPGTATSTLRRRVLLEHEDPYLRLAVAYKNPDPRRRLVEVCAIMASLTHAPGWVALHAQRDQVLRFLKEKNAQADWDKLASRYGRPLTLSPPLTPLQAVTSFHTELRHRALRNLAQQGRAEDLLATVLAADLDRALEARGHHAEWRYIPWGRWPKLRIATLDHRWADRGLTGLLTLVRSLSRLGLLGEQQLSPELVELCRLGATEFARRYPIPELLTVGEQVALEAEEAAFIAGGTANRPN